MEFDEKELRREISYAIKNIHGIRHVLGPGRGAEPWKAGGVYCRDRGSDGVSLPQEGPRALPSPQSPQPRLSGSQLGQALDRGGGWETQATPLPAACYPPLLVPGSSPEARPVG